jgi:DivIVA domain-containing protein
VDRDLIQRRDFPTGRRGYDISAVDEHLRRVADAFEHKTAMPAVPSLAATTSEQVREILEAAERSVADVRAQAGAEAADHVSRVQTATDGMLAQLDHLESELTRLLSALRTSGERLTEGLNQLQADVASGIPTVPDFPPAPAADAPPADAPPAPTADAPPAPAADAPPVPTGDSPAAPTSAADTPPAHAPSATAPPEPADEASTDAPAAANGHDADAKRRFPRRRKRAAEDAPAEPPSTPDEAATLFDAPQSDDASARLIALNMALNGESRADTARFLQEHFADLADLDALLDDVFARAGR